MSKPNKCRDKWRIRWLDGTGVRRSEVFDSYREATAALARNETEADEVRRGIRAAPPPEKTFDDLCDYWIKNRVPVKRSGKDDESVIRRHLRPAFGKMRLRDIGVENSDRFRTDRQHLHDKTVLNLLTLLSTMLNLAVDLGWLLKAPRIKKPTVSLFDQEFRYLRSDAEIQKFLRFARQDGEDAFVMYATAIFTGMREGEIAALRWTDVLFDRRLIVVQRSFEGPTKSGDVRYVPLLAELLPILKAWKVKIGGSLVFPNRDNKMHQPCARIFAERMYRILDKAEFERPTEGRNVHIINFHSLRHTFASLWMMRSGDLFKLQRILGHKDVKMTQRYAHLAPNAFEADFHRMAGLVPLAGAADVVQLRESAA